MHTCTVFNNVQIQTYICLMSSYYTFQIYIVLYPNISLKQASKMLHIYIDPIRLLTIPLKLFYRMIYYLLIQCAVLIPHFLAAPYKSL